MVWEYYGDALIVTGILTTIFLLMMIQFLKSDIKRVLSVPLFITFIGYIMFVIGISLIRGFGGMDWSLSGLIFYVTGFLVYNGITFYKWSLEKRERQGVSSHR